MSEQNCTGYNIQEIILTLLLAIIGGLQAYLTK